MPTGTGHYIDPDLDAIISEALDHYAEHSEAPRSRRDRAAEYAYALNNYTWLLETWQPAVDSVGG